MENESKISLGRPPQPVPADKAQEIIRRLSTGEPLEVICRSVGMPCVSTVHLWREKDKEFAGHFARARAEGYDAIAADALAIADNSTRDTLETPSGPKMDSEWVARSRLRVDTRLKLLAKWYPAKYGDKLDVTGIPAGQSVNIVMPIRERIARLKRAGGESLTLTDGAAASESPSDVGSPETGVEGQP